MAKGQAAKGEKLKLTTEAQRHRGTEQIGRGLVTLSCNKVGLAFAFCTGNYAAGCKNQKNQSQRDWARRKQNNRYGNHQHAIETPQQNMNQNIEAKKAKLNELSSKVIGLCIEIHRELGPGLLESAYEECLAYELSRAGLRFERQRALPVQYKEVKLDCGYRLDFVIEDALILELKAVPEMGPIHDAQLLTYLKLDKKSLGLLINFNVPTLTKGVKRVVCGGLFKEEAGRHGFMFRMFSFLCVSVPLWFK